MLPGMQNLTQRAADEITETPATTAKTTAGEPRPGHALREAYALVFLSSLCIMTLELVAARLVAQHLGVSLYTWTSVIGVVLAGITLGNYVGGKLADIYQPRLALPALFLLASVMAASILPVVDWMGSWERPASLSWPLWILRSVGLTFFLPSAILGTISPMVAKAAIDSRMRAGIGSTVGSLYAFGAAGSILGTFLTGYVLIDVFGSRAIVSGIAFALGILGLLLGLRLRRPPTLFFVGWLLLLGITSVLTVGRSDWALQWGVFLGLRWDDSYVDYYDESNYFTIEVYDADEIDNTKVLALDHLVHSYVALDDVTRLEYPYETLYAAITQRVATSPVPPRAFFIGGGGFTFPRYLEAEYPGARIDVAEIDPAVKAAAQAVLGLPPDSETRIRTHTVDARNFVRDQLRQRERFGIGESAGPRGASGSPDGRAQSSGERSAYDFVYGDAFNDLGVPWHLTTREFNEDIASLLGDHGVYLINVIDVYRPGMGTFLGAFVNTLSLTFDHVYVFASESLGTSAERDTFIVAASAARLPLHDLGDRAGDLEFEGNLFAWREAGHDGGEMRILLERARGIVLTDNYAPVENLIAPVFADQ